MPDRKIKKISSWDGSAGRWDTPEAYCRSCLIDVNSAAGNDEKSKAYCMLPVREPGDGSDTYCDKAVYAAAGGHGISAVKKPDGVSDEVWSSAVKSAANKIISAYGQMDEVAPDAVYEKAGKEPPKKRTIMGKLFDGLKNLFNRAVSMPAVYQQINVLLAKKDNSSYLIDVYIDQDSSMFAIASSNGKLYKYPVSHSSGTMSIGDAIEVVHDYKPSSRGMQISRQKDGSVRWFLLAATSVINRDGEIDSYKLFDNMIARCNRTKKFGYLTFAHLKEKFRLGSIDWLDRDGVAFLASGVFDDTEIARAMIKAYEADPEYWGSSISFWAVDMERSVIAEGIQLPVYTDGILDEISVLPEEVASSLFTAMLAESKERIMDQRVMDAIKRLAGDDEDLLNKLSSLVDDVNRIVKDDNLIHREVQSQENVLEIGDDVIAKVVGSIDISASVEAAVKPVREALETAMSEISQMKSALEKISSLEEKISRMEQVEEAKKRISEGDLPRNQTLKVTYRPKTQEPPQSSPEQRRSLKETADETVSKLK